MSNTPGIVMGAIATVGGVIFLASVLGDLLRGEFLLSLIGLPWAIIWLVVGITTMREGD